MSLFPYDLVSQAGETWPAVAVREDDTLLLLGSKAESFPDAIRHKETGWQLAVPTESGLVVCLNNRVCCQKDGMIRWEQPVLGTIMDCGLARVSDATSAVVVLAHQGSETLLKLLEQETGRELQSQKLATLVYAISQCANTDEWWLAASAAEESPWQRSTVYRLQADTLQIEKLQEHQGLLYGALWDGVKFQAVAQDAEYRSFASLDIEGHVGRAFQGPRYQCLARTSGGIFFIAQQGDVQKLLFQDETGAVVDWTARVQKAIGASNALEILTLRGHNQKVFALVHDSLAGLGVVSLCDDMEWRCLRRPRPMSVASVAVVREGETFARLYTPVEKSSGQTVVLIHSGPHRETSGGFPDKAQWLCQEGIAAAYLEYFGSTSFPSRNQQGLLGHFPEAIADDQNLSGVLQKLPGKKIAMAGGFVTTILWELLAREQGVVGAIAVFPWLSLRSRLAAGQKLSRYYQALFGDHAAQKAERWWRTLTESPKALGLILPRKLDVETALRLAELTEARTKKGVPLYVHTLATDIPIISSATLHKEYVQAVTHFLGQKCLKTL